MSVEETLLTFQFEEKEDKPLEHGVIFIKLLAPLIDKLKILIISILHCIQLSFCMIIDICNIAGGGLKGKLNNLMIQLRKNCNHPDLLESAFDGSCASLVKMLENLL